MKLKSKAVLSKFGWSEDDGLGKNCNGMIDTIKVNYKHDNIGIGHDFGKAYDVHSTFNLSFDNAVQNLKVISTEDGGVKLNVASGVAEAIKAKRMKRFKKQLDDNVKTSSDDGSGADSQNKVVPAIVMLTDEELLKACGGMTGHRAGKFGINKAAKLTRIMEQDQLALKNFDKFKEKCKEENKIKNVFIKDEVAQESNECPPKKHKKNKKSRQDVQEDLEESVQTIDDDDVRPKKKKSKKEIVESFEVCEETDIPKKSKKSKDLSTDD